MKQSIRNLLLVAVTGCFLTVGQAGCGASEPVKTSAPKKVTQTAADEPPFEVAAIHILPKATEDRILPFVSTSNGTPIETPCLVRSKKSKQWTTTNRQVLNTLRQNQGRISAALMTWLAADAPDALPASEVAGWKAVLYEETAMIRHFATDDVRFATPQNCITDTVRMLPQGNEVITTLFGVTGFSLLSPSPMHPDTVKALKNMAQKKRIHIKTVPTFQRARDAQGKPMFKKGKPLFEAPDGTLVLKKDVPLPRDRPVFELVFNVPKGIFVAEGNMPRTRFAVHQAPPGCQINLIFDDMTPRVPECLGSSEMGFGVSMAENPGEVVVKIATAFATGEAVIPYDQTAMVQAGGTGFAWVTPRRLEEGAVLQMDTLTLHPKNPLPDTLKKFSFGR